VTSCIGMVCNTITLSHVRAGPVHNCSSAQFTIVDFEGLITALDSGNMKAPLPLSWLRLTMGAGRMRKPPSLPFPVHQASETITSAPTGQNYLSPHKRVQKKRHTLEFLRGIAHLRPRTNTLGAVARVRSALAAATHDFFTSAGFLYVHTPVLSASDCEGAGEMFQVQACYSHPTAAGAACLPPELWQ
jgi:hypothetical protein